jgi:pimeloyl-ACP methyl ester carboxylesterase
MQQILLKFVGLGLNLLSIIAPKYTARLAYEIFGRPGKPIIRTKEADFLKTAVRIDSTLGGYPVTEYHWGPADGPVVLLSYGWEYNAGRWRHFVPSLVEEGFHVVAYDPPGHGNNIGRGKRFLTVPINAAIQRGLIEKYGRPAAVIAHSFGGACMVHAVRGLSPEMRPLRMAIMATFSSAPRVFAEYQKALGLWPSLYYGMIRRLEKILGAPLESFDMARMSSELGSVEALLVHDPADKVTPFVNAQRYHAYWPGSMLLRANGAGHHLGTAAITEQVLAFVTTGRMPAQAFTNAKPLAANHDLVRFFAGMEC